MRFLSLFAGIGGFDLGLERAGMECAGQVEIDPYCQAVLAKHWPHIKRMGDIREVKGTEFGAVDLVCGGFPCQPFSIAGKRKGKDDLRFLWPEMLRVIKSVRPSWVLGENVANIVGMGFDTICDELEALGFSIQAFDLPAYSVGALHGRRRIWFVCNSKNYGPQHALDGASFSIPKKGQEETVSTSRGVACDKKRFLEEVRSAEFVRTANGLPSRMDRVKACGNSVVPQIVEEIGKAIMQIEERENLKQATSSCAAPGLQPFGPNARVN
jgi:DNA (cytosine-5)-methyltransferase 1